LTLQPLGFRLITAVNLGGIVQNTIVKFGKKATVVTAMALLTTTTSFIPAEAANKAGAPCPKLNAKTRIGGDQYVCTKNPRYPNERVVPGSGLVVS